MNKAIKYQKDHRIAGRRWFMEKILHHKKPKSKIIIKTMEFWKKLNKLLMMMIAPNSLVRQKEGAQGEEEKEVGGRRKEGPTGAPTPGTDAPTGPTRSGVSDARNRRKHGRWCGVLFYRRSRGG